MEKRNNNFRNTTLSAIIIGFTLFFSVSASYAAKLYKWVDDEGNVFFSDQVPPSSMKHKRSTLSNSGLEVDSVDKQKSREEMLREKQLAEEQERLAEEKKRQEERIKEQQLAYDRQLLKSYVTENDLIMMRDRQISTIEGTITLTQSNINKLRKQIEKLAKEAESSDPDTEHGLKTREELQMTRKQVEEYKGFIERRKLEQKELKTRFNQDLKRLRELLSANKQQ